ncbi:MAG: GatB/YqeY domain-containing protein [Pseudomonadota bacterium]
MRDRIQKAMKDALLAKDRARLSTIRLIQAAIKDRDIAARGAEGSGTVSDAEILAILGKMIKQRQESARLYEEGGRLELAEREVMEIAVIEEFLPRQLDPREIEAAVARAVAETEASSIRDMGKVMGVLKTRYAGQMDFAKAGAAVKAALG